MPSTEEELKTLKKDFSRLKDLVEEQATKLASNGAGYIPKIKEDFQNIAHQAGKEMRHFYDNTQKQFSDATHKCEDAIKEYPFRSTALVFMTAILLTTLLRRK